VSTASRSLGAGRARRGGGGAVLADGRLQGDQVVHRVARLDDRLLREPGLAGLVVAQGQHADVVGADVDQVLPEHLVLTERAGHRAERGLQHAGVVDAGLVAPGEDAHRRVGAGLAHLERPRAGLVEEFDDLTRPDPPGGDHPLGRAQREPQPEALDLVAERGAGGRRPACRLVGPAGQHGRGLRRRR
jgi:hypothetical protein